MAIPFQIKLKSLPGRVEIIIMKNKVETKNFGGEITVLIH